MKNDSKERYVARAIDLAVLAKRNSLLLAFAKDNPDMTPSDTSLSIARTAIAASDLWDVNKKVDAPSESVNPYVDRMPLPHPPKETRK
jgi:hypothetical protein